MALKPCPECGREVSDRAPACPGCGNPMMATVVTPPDPPPGPPDVQTIEATGKDWKVVQAMGAGVMVLGVLSCAGGLSSNSSSVVAPGAWLSLAGLALFIIGRVGAWWEHG